MLIPSGYTRKRAEHWDGVARTGLESTSWGGYYHRRLAEVYRFQVPPGQDVLELGCGRGDLLAALEPRRGVGVDFSREMLHQAGQQHPELEFVLADAHAPTVDGPFDIILLSDLINDVEDVQAVFNALGPLCRAETRIIVNIYSHLWAAPLGLAQHLGMATPTLPQNWLTVEDVSNLLNLADMEVIRTWPEVLWPLDTPILAPLANTVLARLWPFRFLALSNFLLARPSPGACGVFGGMRHAPPDAFPGSPPSAPPSAPPDASSVSNVPDGLHVSRVSEPCGASGPRPSDAPEPLVSVIVPARNEEGHIDRIMDRIPEMGRGTEIIFVEGHSRDKTYAAIEQAMARHSHRRCRLFRQAGRGKGDAVRLGFAQAQGEILMILDADMTVPPEDLPRFYAALRSGKADFVNGVRLVYPMEDEAMRAFNLLGNKFFSLAFSWLLGQSVKDTLCGTKVLSKANYEKIRNNRAYFGDFDPFGDFDLLFGAAKLNLKIVDLPIRYRRRDYGETNIQRWKHGWMLLKMVVFAAKRIKFI